MSAKLPTIPVVARVNQAGDLLVSARRDAIQEAYAYVEARQFSDPDDRERLASILSLIRAQTQDDITTDRPQRLGAGGSVVVLPHDPEALEQFAYERDALGRQSGKRGRLIRAKSARELWEDEMLRGGLEPILEELTIAQRDAIRFTWNDAKTQRAAAEALGITQRPYVKRLQGAYAKIRTALVSALGVESPAYRDVRKHLQREGQKNSAAAGRRDQLPPGSQRPTISFRNARQIELGDSFQSLLEQHGCKEMCHATPSVVASRSSSIQVISPAFASVRWVGRLANAVRFAYRVPDREASS